ncbi:MAG: VanZ family protein [Calditrichaeota bacterium]|nr:MAG: VanZ family protein [Calditrichota bacterium]
MNKFASFAKTVMNHRIVPTLMCMAALLMLTFRPFRFIAEPRPWDFDVSVVDMIQNSLLFVPLGIVLRRFSRLSLPFVALTACAFSVMIECLQRYSVFRFANPYDILFNTLGALAGAAFIDVALPAKTSIAKAGFFAFSLPYLWLIGIHCLSDAKNMLIIFLWIVFGSLNWERSNKQIHLISVGWVLLATAPLWAFKLIFGIIVIALVFLAAVVLRSFKGRPTLKVTLAFATLSSLSIPALRLSSVLSTNDWATHHLYVIEILLLMMLVAVSLRILNPANDE